MGHYAAPAAVILYTVVVRVSGAPLEGKLWAHEFGHNTGLGHNPSNLFIMTGGLGPGNTKLSSSECDEPLWRYGQQDWGETDELLVNFPPHPVIRKGAIENSDCGIWIRSRGP